MDWFGMMLPMNTPAAQPSDLLLSEAQRRFFTTFGYLHLPGMLRDVVGEVIDGFERVWANRGGGHEGKPHDGTARSCLVPFIDQDERLSLLLDDPRIHGLLTSLLGDDFNYMGSDGNYYVGNTGWHQDGGNTGIQFLKIAFYLDPLDGSNGALRVIPGSHHSSGGFPEALKGKLGDPVTHFGATGSEVPAMVLATNPGDLAIFDHRIFHSSWNGGQRRRMFTMNCCQRWPEARLPELQEYLGTHARFLIERNVGPAMSRVATPRMRRHLEQVEANDFLLKPKVEALLAQGKVASRG